MFVDLGSERQRVVNVSEAVTVRDRGIVNQQAVQMEQMQKSHGSDLAPHL